MLIGECLKYYSVNGFLMKTQDAEKFSNRMANKYRSMVGEKSGIPVETEYFYAKNRPSDTELKETEALAKKFL